MRSNTLVYPGEACLIWGISGAEKEKAIMIDQNDLLTEFYHDWLNTDVPLGESLRDTLEDSVAMLTRYYGKQNKFRINEEIDRCLI